MRMKRVLGVSLLAAAAAGLAGCGILNSTSVNGDPNTPTSGIAAAFEATGGSSAWRQCRYFEIRGVVAAYRDDSAYLTEHTFHVSPASHALSISAHEPQSDFVWQLVGHQFVRAQGNPALDVSPLQPDYADYAEAVLEILTAPIRLQEWGGRLPRDSATVMIGGRPYHPIEAGSSTGLQRIYYQDAANSRVDLIWLANGAGTKFVVVRGYDYAPIRGGGVLIPTKIELFYSSRAHEIGRRFARIDMYP